MCNEKFDYRQKLIDERRKIITNPFKYYNPFYRATLKKLDAELDRLDIQKYKEGYGR